MADPGGVRIGDAERQHVVDLLGRHTGEGRLTLDEFSERAGQVYGAQTRAELEAVLADLPDLGPATTPPAVQAPQQHPQHDTTTTAAGGQPRRRSFFGIMCASTARGPWRAPRKIAAFAWWGHVEIDLTNASIESPVVDIRASAVMGGVTIIVPEGIPVDVSGFVLMGGTDNRVRNVPAIPGAPVVRIRVRGMWGGVTIRNPRRKRLRETLRAHRHDHRRAVQGIVSDAVSEALDLARNSIDRALGAPTESDRIPDMPGKERERAPAPSPTPTATNSAGTNGAAPAAPMAPPAPAPPPAPLVPPLAPPGLGDIIVVPPERNGQAKRRIPSGTLTILVSDIVGSTQLAERLGDQSWHEVLEAHNAIVRKRVDEHGGIEVKAQGDGFLVVFPSARAAVLAAIDIQQAMACYRDDNPLVPVTLRLGLHTGEVVVADDDVFGQNVVVATRIASVAEPGEIVVSGLTRDLTASASDLGFGSGQDVSLKGISQPWRVHRVEI